MGTVGQGCRLFRQCWNIHPRNLCDRGAGSLSSDGNYVRGTVWQGCRLLKCVGTYLPGTVGQGCMLFKRHRKLPPRHCRAGMQAV